MLERAKDFEGIASLYQETFGKILQSFIPDLLQEEKKTEQKSGKHSKSKAQADPKLN